MRLLGVVASGNYVRENVNGRFYSISSTTVGSSGTTSIVFNTTGLGSTYKHLQIRALARTDRASSNGDFSKIQFNSDTGGAYADHHVYGTGSITGNNAAQDANWIELPRLASASVSANFFGAHIVDILDFANTSKYKTIRGLDGFDSNGGAAQVGLDSGLWMNTNAITSITLSPGNGTNYVQYSTFALYGIK